MLLFFFSLPQPLLLQASGLRKYRIFEDGQRQSKDPWEGGCIELVKAEGQAHQIPPASKQDL